MESVEKLIDKNYKYRPIDGVELCAISRVFFEVCGVANKKAKNGAVKKLYRANISEDIIRDIHYSFMFRDISKEAIMDLAKALVVE